MNKNDSFLLRKFSHELRNPLTAVSSSLQLIERAHPFLKDVKYWSSISDDIAYMISLLDDFTNFSSSNLQLSSFSLASLIKKVALSFAASIIDTGIKFTSQIDLPEDPFIGDAVKLQEVLRNLLKNAADACKPNDTIHLLATSEKGTLSIRIQDSGCGIDKELLPTIFEPFVTYKRHGNGLGLPICKQIVEAHHGSIHISSRVSVGTLVLIQIPANQQGD